MDLLKVISTIYFARNESGLTTRLFAFSAALQQLFFRVTCVWQKEVSGIALARQTATNQLIRK